MVKQYHIGVGEGEVAKYVLLPGDPNRVRLIASFWDEAKEVANNREYVTYTGKYKGVPISCTSTGIGCPSTGIALEELARCGAEVFIRVGTCGTLLDHVKNGDMVVFDGAMRLDGASVLYAPIEYPAVASHDVVEACITALEGLDFPHHVGITRSADTFYAGHGRPGSSFNNYWQSKWKHHFEDLRRLNIPAAEMEASLIFVLARVWGLRAGGISVVLDNMFEASGDTGKFKPETALDHSPDHIKRLAMAGNEAVRILYERDQAKAKKQKAKK